MVKIKLFKLEEMSDGVIRLQSQLYIGKRTCDFILENNVLKCWGNGINGFGFYECETPYEIITDISEMSVQQL